MKFHVHYDFGPQYLGHLWSDFRYFCRYVISMAMPFIGENLKRIGEMTFCDVKFRLGGYPCVFRLKFIFFPLYFLILWAKYTNLYIFRKVFSIPFQRRIEKENPLSIKVTMAVQSFETRAKNRCRKNWLFQLCVRFPKSWHFLKGNVATVTKLKKIWKSDQNWPSNGRLMK